MKILVVLGHPEVYNSLSQQFLLQAGRSLTSVDYLDLQAEYDRAGAFDIAKEQARLLAHDRIILQFPLYWYTAPAIMKAWQDTVWPVKEEKTAFYRGMQGKEFGIVVIAGVKEAAFRVGDREGRSLSELLSPYDSFARYFGMKYLPPLAIHQFHLLPEKSKMSLLYEYTNYLENGHSLNRTQFYEYILAHLKELDDGKLPLDIVQKQLFHYFVEDFEEQGEDLADLFRMMRGWG
ncbi:MAG: NAD(P)H-dependent oxidoreductase [Gallicola sp.]|nr:NAD(P)H-dependent oxidoreductase [Gallicola sp.]